MMTYGDTVKVALKKEQMTQVEFAKLAGISYVVLNQIINNKRTASDKTIDKINALLNLKSEAVSEPKPEPKVEKTETNLPTLPKEEEPQKAQEPSSLTPKSKRVAMLCEFLGVKQFEPFLLQNKAGLFRFSNENLERYSKTGKEWYTNEITNDNQYNLFIGTDVVIPVSKIANQQLEGGKRYDKADS